MSDDRSERSADLGPDGSHGAGASSGKRPDNPIYEVVELEPPPKPPLYDRAGMPPTATAAGVPRDSGAGSSSSANEPPDFVREGFGSARTIAVVGTLIGLSAMVICALGPGAGRTAAVVLVFYQCLLHTVTGTTAVLIAARFAERPMGCPELAAARMLVAVASFSLAINLDVPIPSLGRSDEALLAVAAYVLSLWVLFRWGRRDLFVVSSSHAVLWFAVWLGSKIELWASASAVARPSN